MNPLQYITQDHPRWSHSDLVQMACDAGIKWVQLRMKNATEDEICKEAKKAKTICASYPVKLILNDHPHLVQELDLDGVHLGLTDMPTDEARTLLGPSKIIGGTANTLAEVLMQINKGVDYVGVGPFRYTTTKKDLSPVLGVDGYELIALYLRNKKINIPLVAIGGITERDFSRLQDRGVNAIAVSGLITRGFEEKTARKTVRMYRQLSQEVAFPYAMLWKCLRAGNVPDEVALEYDATEHVQGIRSIEGKWSIRVVNQRVMEEHWQSLKEAEEHMLKTQQIQLIHVGGHEVSTVEGAQYVLEKHKIIP